MSEECLALTTYFGERDRTPRGLLGDELLEIYGELGLQASVLLRGAEGFGRLAHLHSDRLLTLSEDLPVVSIAVDSRERIEGGARARASDKATRADHAGASAPLLRRDRPLGARAGAERGDEADHLHRARESPLRAPLFVTICELFKRRGLAGATVLLGVDGTRGGRRSRARFFGQNAQVPMIIVAVGESERIAEILPELGAVISDPLLTVERVQVCKRDGELLATPHELRGSDEHGLQLWQKLTVFSSHAAMHGGRPLHREIVRRLREADAAGATSVRGIWGFHGEHAPHGDRFLQIRRHVPVVTIAIDTPERTARSFQIIDELTREHGLVTSEVVPALSARSAHANEGGLRLAGPARGPGSSS